MKNCYWDIATLSLVTCIWSAHAGRSKPQWPPIGSSPKAAEGGERGLEQLGGIELAMAFFLALFLSQSLLWLFSYSTY